ncbi:hypothetical protein F5X71_12945 [Nocardia brasiliensis]|uniref:Uncharacterized protein n=1 Tax=Nocardia brasiliensis TaxID=37326 RepID=A0A6G9XQA0_NOCBR|nr:type IV toxin-antitoxin system AbiEi family antitoxin domain-containing protein [Nocardia brasiliensis]QIS03098.1 hypothetical protein F5X71_12945 [Nocardia brasiliensis]
MRNGADVRTRLAELAESQWGLLTTAQAATVGVGTKQLQRLVDHAVLVRLRHGVYRLTGVPDSPAEPIRTEWLALEPARTAGDRIGDQVPLGVVSHRSAADLHGLGDLDADYIEFTVPTRRGTRSPDIRFHRATLTDSEWTLVDGLPVTTPARTIADLAAARTDGGHLASVVRDALLQGAPIDSIAAALRPYAHRYGAPVDNGSALVTHFINQAGVPESALALSVPALEPLVSANRAANEALEQLMRGQRSTHLTTALTSLAVPPTTQAAMTALRDQLARTVSTEQLAAALHQVLTPITENPEWRKAMAHLQTQLLQSVDPNQFPSTEAARDAAAALLRDSVAKALIDAAATPAASPLEADE